METINITELYLQSMEVHRSKGTIEFDSKKVVAALNVEIIDKSILACHIELLEKGKAPLFTIQANYTFFSKEEIKKNDEAMVTIMNILQPRLEQMIAYLSYETGYHPDS